MSGSCHPTTYSCWDQGIHQSLGGATGNCIERTKSIGNGHLAVNIPLKSVQKKYTTKSAYQIQFDESFAKIKIFPIWKARAETLLHPEILTPNNLSKRNWLHDPICKLCKFNPETLSHLCKDYIFIKEVWSIVRNWFNLSQLQNISQKSLFTNTRKKCREKFDKAHKASFDGILIYVWWNIWKEQNRRTFQQQELQPL